MPHLRVFADAIGLSVYKEGAGVIAVRTPGFLTEPKQVLGRAIDAGVGIAIPASDLVIWCGETPVEATVEVLKWHFNMLLSLGLVPEFLWHAQRQQSRHADYPVVFSDPSGPKNLHMPRRFLVGISANGWLNIWKAASRSTIELRSPRVMMTLKAY